jgi:DNA-directed RNA polymerase alpha subunit
MQIVATSISNLTAYSDYMKYGYDAYTKMDKERTAYLIDNVGFTPRVRNLLRRNGYSDIRQIKIEQLKVRKGIGATTIAEIEDKLQERKIDAK